MASKQAGITRKQMREALARSGYLLEARIEARLREKGYFVESNLFYPDPETGKQREYDLRALTAEFLTEGHEDSLWPTFIIECVNNPQPLAFVARTSAAPSYHAHDIRFVGIPSSVKLEGSTEAKALSDAFGMSEYNHYCDASFATQFCSFQQKKGAVAEWMALHDEEHHLSFKKLTDALEADARQFDANWVPGDREWINVTAYYPVLVVQNGMVRVDAANKRVRLRKVDRILFRRSLLFDGQERNYFIDVVTEKAFPRLLEDVERETRETVARMRTHLPALRESVSREASQRRLAFLRRADTAQDEET